MFKYHCYRLKTWLRSEVEQEKLCGLTLLNIHHEIDVSVDDIIKRFEALKKRKINSYFDTSRCTSVPLQATTSFFLYIGYIFD